MERIKLIKLREEDKKEYKRLMQEAFQYGYEAVYGKCDDTILPENDINQSLSNPKCDSYEMIDEDGNILGGAIVEINLDGINHLDFLFVSVKSENKGIGQKIWWEIEKLYPNTIIWKTCTPYFDKRNIYFYVNKLKFKIVEYIKEDTSEEGMFVDCGGMFEFEKEM